MSETRDVKIDNLLLELPPLSPCRPSIFRVDGDVRSLNEKLYDPKAVSIGPLHCNEDHLRKMLPDKLEYLKLMRKETSVDRYVVAIRSVEQKARRCYADHIEFTPDEFVEMLVAASLLS